MKISMICSFCEKEFEIEDREHYRQTKKGRTKFFCSISHSTSYNNFIKYGIVSVEKTCPVCNLTFDSTTSKKAKTYCSRSCASKGSVTEKRRAAAKKYGKENIGNLIGPQAALKLREAWKYIELENHLISLGKQFEFEYCFPGNTGFIYDLILFDDKVIVEFDAKYHSVPRQVEIDTAKSDFALNHGYTIVRVETPSNCVISLDLVLSIL